MPDQMPTHGAIAQQRSHPRDNPQHRNDVSKRQHSGVKVLLKSESCPVGDDGTFQWPLSTILHVPHEGSWSATVDAINYPLGFADA